MHAGVLHSQCAGCRSWLVHTLAVSLAGCAGHGASEAAQAGASVQAAGRGLCSGHDGLRDPGGPQRPSHHGSSGVPAASGGRAAGLGAG